MTSGAQARLLATAGLVLVGVAAQAATGAARVTRLGNPETSFLKPAPGKDALQTPDDLRRLLRGHLDDVMVVVSKAASIDAGLARLTREDIDGAAQRAQIDETTFEPGSAIPWMAYRKQGRPEVLHAAAGVVWAGAQPFGAYVLEFETHDATTRYRWTLTAPKACGNLWISVASEPIPPPKVALSAGSVCLSESLPLTIALELVQPGDAVVLSVGDRTIETFPATNGSHARELAELATGTHVVRARVEREGAPGADASANATVEPCLPTCALAPLPEQIRTGQRLLLDAWGASVHNLLSDTAGIESASISVLRDGVEVDRVTLSGSDLQGEYVPQQAGEYTLRATVTDSVGQQATNTCVAGPVRVTAPLFFVGGYVGKERAVREEFAGGRCAPLVGLKVGVLPEIGDDVELELALGGKLNTRDSDNSSLFVDVAINRVLSRGFLGAGVSAWDLTIGDTRSLGALFHGGLDLDRRGRIGFEIEGRVPFDRLDDLENNYQFWAGLRIRPGR